MFRYGVSVWNTGNLHYVAQVGSSNGVITEAPCRILTFGCTPFDHLGVNRDIQYEP